MTGAGGETIDGSGKLEFAATVAVGQTVDFVGPKAALILGDPQGFSGEISGFGGAMTQTLTLLGPWTYLNFNENSGHTQGALQFQDGAAKLDVTLLGDYTASNFLHTARVGGGVIVTYS